MIYYDLFIYICKLKIILFYIDIFNFIIKILKSLFTYSFKFLFI